MSERFPGRRSCNGDCARRASPVAQELSPNGVILLHDYFPNGKPLWPDGSVVAGPFEATEKLRERGMKLKVVPLGGLPWATKLGSHVTSLAIAVRDQ